MLVECTVGPLAELDDPGCREFRIGEGDWPFRGFVVRQGEAVHAYHNHCVHAGHPLNWMPDSFLTADKSQIVCASHGALFDIASGECVGGPGKGRALKRLPCEVRNGLVVVHAPVSA